MRQEARMPIFVDQVGPLNDFYKLPVCIIANSVLILSMGTLNGFLYNLDKTIM